MYIQRVDDLVNELVTIDNTPIDQTTYTNDVIIQMMDDSLQGTIVPLITSAREEFFVTTYSSIVGPQPNNALTRLLIPGESAGFRVRDLYVYDIQAGNTDFNQSETARCRRINPDIRPYYTNGVFSPIFLPSVMPSYYIENNNLVFWPNLTQQWVAKMRVFKSPNHLVAYNKCCGQILSKNGSNIVTVDNVPQANGNNVPVNVSANASGVFGDWYNFAGVNPTQVDVLAGGGAPFNFRTSVSTGYVLINKSILGLGGTSVTLDSDTYNSVNVGDYLVTSQCSPFIQYVPFQALNLIKLLASMRILKAQGDLMNWSVSAQLYNQAKSDFLNLITPKVENSIKKVGGGGRGALLGNLGVRRVI